MENLRASNYAPVAHPFLKRKRACFVLDLWAVKSGKVMAFKFPVLKPMTIDSSGLPVYNFKC